MKVKNKIIDRKKITGLFLLCFVVYFTTYLGRLNYSASLAEIIKSEGYGKGQAGLIGTLFFFAYGAGQLISGFLGDRLPCKWLVFMGLSVSGVLNFLMGYLHSPAAMAGVWCLNGLMQAFIWSPLIRLLYDYLKTETRLKLCLYMNFSVPLGTVAAYFLTASLITAAGWRYAFFVPSLWILAVAVLWITGMSRLESYAAQNGEAPVEDMYRETAVKQGEGASATFSWKVLLAASGLGWLLFSLCVQGALKDGVTTWIPTYLEETFRLGSMAAILSTMVIPLCNLFGVTLASLADRLIGRNEVKTSSLFFGICGAALAVLLLWGKESVGLSLAMLAVSTTSMMAVNTMLIAVMPSRFGRLGKASSVSGIMNSSVYVGGAVSTYGIGALSAAFGWSLTILLWIFGAVISMLLCMAMSGRWKKYAASVLK